MVYGDWMTITFYRSYLVQPSYEVLGSLLILGGVLLINYMLGHKYIRPKAIHDSEIVEEYSQHYIYFACIAFINSVGLLILLNEAGSSDVLYGKIKTASLRWHSPMLDDISAVRSSLIV